MKVLIIGGTKFLGRALVEAALAKGHEVTLFNRGNTNPDLFPEVEKLRGNRDGELDALKGRKWDVAIDTCGYVPRIVKQSAELLADAVEHYTFISTISIYAEEAVQAAGFVDEETPLASLADETTEEVTGETYGGLKALCEKAAEAAMPGRVLQIRPGLIVGPYDPTDRYTYWAIKMARGGQFVVPPMDSLIQGIDVRDLAEWTLRLAEARQTGAYNGVGPAEKLTIGRMVEACQNVFGDQAAEVIPMTEEFLLEQGVQPWVDYPAWLPTAYVGMNTVRLEKSIASGLTHRSVETTIKDTVDWYIETRGSINDPLKTGMSDERMAELLAAQSDN